MRTEHGDRPHEDRSDRQSAATASLDGHGVDIAYFEAGDPSDHAVVFLHGIPTWSNRWRGVAPYSSYS